MEPLTARRLNGKLILEIDEQQFVAEATRNPANHLKVVDRDAFMEFVREHIFTLTHDVDFEGARPSWWRRLSETLAKAAASMNQGVRRNEVVQPTCNCDPENHDGG